MSAATQGERWLLPEGIEEVLPPRAGHLERLRRELLDLYRTWGYELVVPPFIEYLDSLLTGTGRDLDLRTFKLTDQLSGRTLGVRADMTPQVSRIAATRLGNAPRPLRLCYAGQVLQVKGGQLRPERQFGQVGVELIGAAEERADAEVIAEHLGHLPEVAWEFFGSDTAREAVRRKVTSMYPEHEIEDFTEHFWGLIQQWRADQRRDPVPSAVRSGA